METTTFNSQKVQNRSVEVQAAHVLREAITSGNNPLGLRLIEIYFAEQPCDARRPSRTSSH